MGAVTETFPAVAVAIPVRPFFETPGAVGRVLSSFERSCYFETEEGQLIAVLGAPLGRGAFALTVAGIPPFAVLRPHDRVSIENDTVRLGEVRVDVRTAGLWDPALPPLVGPVDDGLRALADHLRTRAPKDGLARAPFKDLPAPTALLQEGRQALAGLRRGLLQGDAAAITGAAARLAGLGPGLTPSGDDVLAGILLALRLWPEAAGPLGAKVAATLLVGTAAPRTGRISRAYLWAARQGHAADSWHDLVDALPRGGIRVTAAADRILQIGETSGADMLAGFLFSTMR